MISFSFQMESSPCPALTKHQVCVENLPLNLFKPLFSVFDVFKVIFFTVVEMTVAAGLRVFVVRREAAETLPSRPFLFSCTQRRRQEDGEQRCPPVTPPSTLYRKSFHALINTSHLKLALKSVSIKVDKDSTFCFD